MAVFADSSLFTPSLADHEWIIFILGILSAGAIIEILHLLITKAITSFSDVDRLLPSTLRTKRALALLLLAAAAALRWWHSSLCVAPTLFTDNGVLFSCRGDSCDEYRQHVWTCSYERELRLIEAMQRQLDAIAWIPLEDAFQAWSLPVTQQLHASADFATIYDNLRNCQLPNFIYDYGDRDVHVELNKATQKGEWWDFIAFEVVGQLQQLEEECSNHQAVATSTNAMLQGALEECCVWLAEDDSCNATQANSFCPTNLSSTSSLLITTMSATS